MYNHHIVGPLAPPQAVFDTRGKAEKVTDLINGINDALQVGDVAAFNANLTELMDVSPQDAEWTLRILAPLAGL